MKLMFFKGGLTPSVLIMSALMSAAFAVHAAPPKELAPKFLDWQVYAKQPVGEVCRGYYLSPELDLPEAHLPTEQARLFADAKQLNYSAEGGLLMQGDVRLRKGSLYLTSEQASLNAARDLAKLKGNISIRQEGLLLRGVEGEYQLNTEQLQMSEAHYVVHQQRLRGSAWKLEQGADGIVTLRDSSMTSCSPGDNAWRLVAGRLNLNRDSGFGDAFNVRMEILKVPVFYWPWLRFPIDDRRHTGLLSPTISWSKNSGLDYQQPFYWNIAPNVDATFYPRQIDKRGFMLGGEVRYLTQKNSGKIYYAHLNNDIAFDEYDRWNFTAKHNGSLTSNFSYQLDFSQVSDNRYLEDLNSNSFVTAATELQQQLSFSYKNSGWQTNLNFQGYQKLNPAIEEIESPYKLFDLHQGRKADKTEYYHLPQLEIRKTARWGNNLQSTLLIDLTQFSGLFDKELEVSPSVNFKGHEASSLALKPNSLDQYYFTNAGQYGVPNALRLHLQPSFNAEWYWPWAYIKPEAKLKFTQYSLKPYWSDLVENEKRNKVDLKPQALVPVFSLDSGLYLERDTHLLNKKMLQTLEPRIFLAYIPFVEQYQIPNFFDGSFIEEDVSQLFRAERTTGLDRVGDIKKVTLGLTQRLISQNTGHELASLSVAKAVYLDNRRIDNNYLHPDTVDNNGEKLRDDFLPAEDQTYKNVRKTSSLALQASITLAVDIKLNSNLLWDDYFHKTESSNTYLTYTGLANSQFNFGHSYTSNYQNTKHLQGTGFKGSKPDIELLKDNWSYLEQAEEQIYASMIYSLNQYWRIFAKQGHDLKRSEKLDSITGVEYNSCCWQIQLVYRDWVDNIDTSPAYKNQVGEPLFDARKRDYGFFLNVVFKGLGGMGQPTPQHLEKKEAQGYTDRP